MEATIIVNTQVYENYNFSQFGYIPCDDERPRWKAKGGFQFQVKLDHTDLLYMDGSDIQNVLLQMLEEQSSNLERFEFVGYEVVLNNPHQLSTGDFMNKLESLKNA